MEEAIKGTRRVRKVLGVEVSRTMAAHRRSDQKNRVPIHGNNI